MISIIQIIISTLTSVLSFSMILLIMLKGKKGDLQIKYVLFLLIVFVWCSGEVLLTITLMNAAWLDAHHMYHLFILMIGFYRQIPIYSYSAIWLLFCLSYSYKTLNELEKKLYHKYKWILFIPGIICYSLVPSNDRHGFLLYSGFENGEWVSYIGLLSRIQMFIDLIYYIFALIIVLKHISRSYPYYKKQSLLITISAFIPSFITIIYFSTSLYQKTHNFDIAPLMLLITLLFFNLALLKFRFLNITPVAFSKMADDLNESILIVDADGIIAYFNQAFKQNFSSCPSLEIDDQVKIFTSYLRNKIRINRKTEEIIQSIETGSMAEISGEIAFEHIQKYFAVDIQSLFVKKDFIGQIITFYDITDYKNLLLEVENKNAELESANKQIKEHAAAVEELAVARERNRFAGDVHDSVGHTMTVLISLIGVCSLACDKKDTITVKQKLDEMMEVALKGHNELKRSVQGIMLENRRTPGIVQSILSLVREFERTGVKVDFTVDGQENSPISMHSRTIYGICQEALTNSLKHGKSTHVNILMSFTAQSVSLYIFDNGAGCKEIRKNVGLTCMEERVRKAGGKISFGSDGEQGFNIHVEIPAAAKAY